MKTTANPQWVHLIETDSTQRIAKEHAIQGAAHGTVILAGRQTLGRGRQDKSFFSPEGGLYMSVILKAGQVPFSEYTPITAYTALCVCDAIYKICGLNPLIKWVNDIMLNGKKVGGILTEALADSGAISTLIVGIGINISAGPEDFPDDIKNKAGSLFPKGKTDFNQKNKNYETNEQDPTAFFQNIKSNLASEIVNQMISIKVHDEKELFALYKEKLCMLNQLITISNGGNIYTATALDIDGTGRLIIQKPDGRMEALSSGEISIHYP
jgi:BirA family biotin operon repressor/biotin-[acetyl-CoA-carboxylase] ligase